MEKQNENFFLFDVEDITSLNTKFSPCLSIAHTLPPSLICVYACQSVFICVFIGLHTYSQVDVQTNIFAHIILQEIANLFQFHLRLLSHFFFFSQERMFPPWEHGSAISPHLQFTRSFSCACLMRNNTPNGSVILPVIPLHVILLYHK